MVVPYRRFEFFENRNHYCGNRRKNDLQKAEGKHENCCGEFRKRKGMNGMGSFGFATVKSRTRK
jgi:hypothetical protein